MYIHEKDAVDIFIANAFDVRFYLVAIPILLFDIEVVHSFPRYFSNA